MKPDEFNLLASSRFDACSYILGIKSQEYSRDADKLHNFRRAADMLGCTPEAALVGMWTKHIISILDMVDDLERGILPPEARLSEKMTDIINYSVLLEALITERLHVLGERQQ